MTPERWQQVDNLLQQVIDVSPAERSARLEELCPNDSELRGEVESLISLQAQAQNFLMVPAVEENLYLLCEDQVDSMVGLTLGRYTIEAQLGGGGMGEVYLAHDAKLDQKVAIKFLSSCLRPSVAAKERLALEAKALAQLDHPNICRVIDIKEVSKFSFIVMQYVAGETLADKLKNRSLNFAETLNIGIQVLEALSEAHSVGIVHRDIKPQNIMINPRGQVKVLDFGLVKLVGTEASDGLYFGRAKSGLSRTGECAGTPPYMSPEQAAGAPVDGRTDLFAVGVILYECVTGTRPFAGETDETILKRVRQFHPAPPSQFNPRVSPELDNIILRALAKVRDARYQSANEFLADLLSIHKQIQDEDDQKTKPLPAHNELRTRSRFTTVSRPFTWVSTFGIAVLILSLLLNWLIRGKSPAPPSPEAANWYQRGVAGLREGAYHQASKELEQAIQQDNQFALAHARLAEAYAELDYTDKAKDEIIRGLGNEFSLKGSDQLYLRAITNTVLRNFGPAIDNYELLLQEAADNEKAGIYFDLGRAYEKNDQLKEAQDQYHNALKLVPQDAAASLRIGIICAQQGESVCASEAFQNAESWYTAQGNVEGVTEVLFERGFWLLNKEEVKTARADLESALQRARVSKNVYQQVRALQALSGASAINGETNLATQLVTEAIDLARSNGLENQLTAGFIWLGNNFLQAGNLTEAEKYYRRALELAERDKLRLNQAWARLQLGSLFLTRRKTQEALDYLNQAVPFYEQGRYRLYLLATLLLRGRATRNTGDYDTAFNTFQDVLRLAEQLGDRTKVAISHEEIGSVLLSRERYPEALARFDESCKIYNSWNLTLYAGYCAMHRASVLWQIGRYTDARAALREATAKTETGDKKLLLASTQMTEAFMELSEQRNREARVRARKALELANEEFGLTATQARYVLGVTSGANRAARQLCKTAVDLARQTDDQYLISSAQLAQAEVLLDSSNAQQALSLATETQQSFARSDQKDSEWHAWLIAARASQRLGNKATMHEYAVKAKERLVNLEKQLGREAYNGYLSRPDIQNSLKQLELLLKT